MKRIFLVITIFLTHACSAHPLRYGAAMLACAISAHPMLQNCYLSRLYMKHREILIDGLEDSDPTVETFVRTTLQNQGYAHAHKIPIKVRPGDFRMESSLDYALCFSESYAADLKEILDKEKISELTEDEKRIKADCMLNLRHEMFHINHEHAQQSTLIKGLIPASTEIATMPLVVRFLKTSPPLFASCLAGTILFKRVANTNLEYMHRKTQERAADKAAFEECDDLSHLEATIAYRAGIPHRAITHLYIQRMETGTSGFTTFDMLARLLDGPAQTDDMKLLSSDLDYKEQCRKRAENFSALLHNQPGQWPLRLLQYTFEPDHPFVLDTVRMAEERVKKLRAAQKD